ncbi:fatty acid desaturase [Neptunicoccus cionae]|uniref:Fatty acid desaturase n=1 Tax=Neptunicoccus cionae TaxID=2035344 RepID=A0A916QZX2_9RHOB|nr:fatty acid desaturase [Amylibacter cionae]GGA17524.1 fatty acid desaturase [Amylibacter cionae]
MTHKDFLKSLSTENKAALTARSDSAGLWHLAMHAGLILLCGVLITLKIPFWWALLLPQGILIAFLFTLQHEATHKTPFRNEQLNEWVGWACGLLIFQPFLWFRYFHLMHHRYTNDPENDPELAGLPKPGNWPAFLWHLSTIGYWGAKASLFWTLCFRNFDSPYLPQRAHPRIRKEARGLLAIYAVALAFTLFVHSVLFWVWILPLIFGFPVLRLYLLAEHGRCPTVADMFINTRTTYTNRLVRMLAWNMPYHVEHHTFPQVPFHQLPAFHVAIRDHLAITSPGYASFAKDYVAAFDRDQG